jgi:hypothetical protein
MLAFGAAFAGFLLPRERQGAHILIIAWTAANIVGAKMGVRTFGHYFVPVLPGIALLSAAFVEVMLVAAQRAGRAPAWKRYAPAVAAVVIATGWQLRENVSFYFADSSDARVQREFGQQGPMVFAQADAVAEYIGRATAGDDEILVWGAEPEVYFLADRPAASRFIYGLSLDFARETVESLRADFLEQQPGLVVISRGGLADEALLADQGYRRTFVAGWLEVYERGEQSDVAGAATAR